LIEKRGERRISIDRVRFVRSIVRNMSKRRRAVALAQEEANLIEVIRFT
jgi:hypothetical protein